MIQENPKGFRLLVALSGGVDSAVTAMLLKEQGYDVVGVTLALQGTARPYIEDARRVAEKIGIPHHVFDQTDIFSEIVVRDFIDSYLRGETPLPCALCNKKIKFGTLVSKARELGAQALATGHYAQRRIVDGKVELHCGEDRGRDQSYFLFGLDQGQLDFARFPLGKMRNKGETRELARRFGLPVAAKPDSQDICFVPGGDYVGLIQRSRPLEIAGGAIVDEKGNVLGRHDGIVHFTIGQRRGINLTNRVGENNKPLYVVRLDRAKNEVVVGPREALARREVFLRDMNWLGDSVPEAGIGVQVKLRSVQAPVSARFQPLADKRGLIVLDAPVFGVAAGQAGVLYDGSRVLGGGWIEP